MNELISPITLYWIFRLDNINEMFGVVTVLSVICCAIFAFMYHGGKLDDVDEYVAIGKSGLRWCIPLIIIGFAGFMFIPTTKEACAICGIPKILNNPQIQELGRKTIDVVDIGLNTIKERLTENKNGNSGNN